MNSPVPNSSSPAFETARALSEEARDAARVGSMCLGQIMPEVCDALDAALDENAQLREALQRIARGDFPKMVTGDFDPLADAGDFAAKSLKGGNG